MRKQNDCIAKKKARLDNLRASVQAPAADSAVLLLFCPASVSCSGSFASLSSCPGSPTCLLPLPDCPKTPTALLSRLIPAPVPRSLAVLSPLLMLGLTPPHLASTALKTFKQALSNELLRRSTSFAESLCPFPPLGSLPNKTDRKRTFDIAFINSRPLAGNHAREEVDLSFAECGYPAAVKLNRSWQLELLDLKPVCIIETICLAAAIFWDTSFTLCHCYTVKLAFKLGLKTRGIASSVVKERIKFVWANRNICQLDQLFRKNLE